MIRWTYIDTSAAVKLFRHEDHSVSFDEWLAAHPDGRPVTSDLTRAELRRTLQAVKASEDAWRRAELWIGHTALIRLTPGLCDTAGLLPAEPRLRSLDALHLAAALEMSPALKAFVTYDKQLSEVARAHGLPVASPGFD